MRVSAFLLLFSLLTVAKVSHATTYYVSTSGSDSNACTSSSSACRTISRAVSLAGSAGDIVQVGAGTYSESVTLSKSGTSSAPITLRGQDGNGCPTVSVTDVYSPTGTRPASTAIIAGSVTVKASYVTVDCLHLKGSGSMSIGNNISNVTVTSNEVEGTGSSGSGIVWPGITSFSSAQYASAMTVSKNYIHGVSVGLFMLCNNCTISDNEITALTGNEPGSDHDYIDAWGTNTTISHNYMHGNTCNSCQGYDCHMDCIQTWNTTGDGTEVSKNITFTRNVCFNHHEGVIAQDNAGNGDVANWTVTDNVFGYGPYDDGSGNLCKAGTVHPWCWVFETGKMGTSNQFLNNTCISGTMGFRSNTGSAVYKNNLYYTSGSQTTIYDNSGATVTGANNMDYAASGTFKGTFSGDVVNKNPQFISTGTGGTSQCLGCNYNIQSSSPAIDAGVSTAPTVTVDLSGTTRPQGSAYDIGAYEYKSGGSSQKPAAPQNLSGVAH